MESFINFMKEKGLQPLKPETLNGKTLTLAYSEDSGYGILAGYEKETGITYIIKDYKPGEPR